MSARISEQFIFDNQGISLSTSSVISNAIPIKGSETVAFVISMATAAVGTGFTVQAYQGNSTAPNTTAIAGATASIGSSLSTFLSAARVARIYVSTAATSEAFVLNGTTFTYDSAASGTGVTFGATAGASAALGIAVAMLSSVINKNMPNLTATTGASWVEISVKDQASTYIDINSSAASPFTPAYVKALTILEIQTAGLNTTCDHVCIQISSALGSTVAAVGSICAIKHASIKPTFKGQVVNDKNT